MSRFDKAKKGEIMMSKKAIIPENNGKVVANNGFPFELKKKTVNPYVTLTEDEVLKKLEASRQHAAEGMVRDADDVISDMRQKYGI